MDFFDKNLQALKRFRPELYNKIENFNPSGSYGVVVSSHPKKYPNLVKKDIGMLAYDNEDPIGKVLINLKNKIILPVVNMLFGFGLGYEAISIIQKHAVENSIILIIDPEIEPFYLALKNIDLTSLISDDRVVFLIGVREKEMFLNFRSIFMQKNYKVFVKAINIIDNPLSVRVNVEFYKKCMGHLKDGVREVLLHFGNDPWDSLIGIENTLLNINEIIKNPGIKELKDVFKGKPGIVVATGPSLNKNINLLKGLENKAVICAADASVRVMKRYGLKPHLVTSLERVLPTAKLFEGLTVDDVKDVFLAACPVIRPETYANFPGERIIVYRNFATFQWIDIDKGILDIGPSAANMAFKVLEYLGCNPIILIGQDLAFGEDDVTHASGATFGERENQYYAKGRILEVEGNYLPRVKTTDVWYKFLKFYENDISQFKGDVINATEGGAKIPGTKVLSFKDTIERYIIRDFDVIDIIRSNLNYPSKEEIASNREKIIKKTDDAIEYSKYVKNIFNEGIEFTDMFNKEIIEVFDRKEKVDEKRYLDLFYKVQEPMKVFSEKKFYEIFMHFVQSYYMTTMVEINGVQASDIDVNRKNFSIVTLFHDMYIVMVKLIEAMERSLLEMRNKLSE
ncbi:MAG: DUF115 domain-containing protein [Calditerrivibrio sp.]|nr:DUF115 domain-containing protein [Calditerrivibrio sp.]